MSDLGRTSELRPLLFSHHDNDVDSAPLPCSGAASASVTETPTANGRAPPTLAPDSTTTTHSYDTPSELPSALGPKPPYSHPYLNAQQQQQRANKRRRINIDSASEPPWSAVSPSLCVDGHTSASSQFSPAHRPAACRTALEASGIIARTQFFFLGITFTDPVHRCQRLDTRTPTSLRACHDVLGVEAAHVLQARIRVLRIVCAYDVVHVLHQHDATCDVRVSDAAGPPTPKSHMICSCEFACCTSCVPMTSHTPATLHATFPAPTPFVPRGRSSRMIPHT
ncbi:hypothetical protein B0H12DRAFT_1235639 [Mycena haematopus]|nr:hypothetical protein B0H12DRAFT_1235637 [Mycena haematopus]KAJ7246126.1 hypothetical protein B0H12DRAFT_1235639 [Mycena haematopus]